MKKSIITAALLCAALSVNGCASKNRIAFQEETVPGEALETLVTIEEEQVPLASEPKGGLKVPSAPGTVSFSSNSVTLDASNTANGYVMVRYSGKASKIKVQVVKGSGETYTYDLNARAAYEVFPLTEGNGMYTIRVLEQVQGSQYAVKFSNDLSVSLNSEFEPFLYPNQYVNFSEGSAVVQKGAQLAADADSSLGIVANVYNYIVDNFTYDKARAATVKPGYLPDIDAALAEKKGICFDYAAVMTAMLRSQNIPAKLVVGYTGSLYHAWVNVYIEGRGWVDHIIYFDGHNWELMDPTFASTGAGDTSVEQYIKDSSNYKAKYSY